MIKQSFKMAFSAIMSNKMRSFLTMLGIIIGVLAVVVLVSVTSSATDSVTAEFEELGATKLTVSITDQDEKAYTLEEAISIAEDSDNISYVVPTATSNAVARDGETSINTSVVGTIASYEEMNQIEMQSGRFLRTPDIDNNSAVAAIGAETAEELFGHTDVVGEEFTINGRLFTVVGVLEETEDSLMGSDNSNIFIPYTMSQRLFYVSGVTSFTALATANETVDLAEEDLTDILMAKYNDEDSFMIINQSSIISSIDSVTATMSLMMGGISSISLLVGGIGIMNIMLVSVTERTREIGIRKAIGASRRRILAQFLIESMVLSTFGGLIGILSSWGVLGNVSAIAESTYAMSPEVALIAVAFSMGIGVLFGINPANKAAKMLPIQALRTE